MNYVGVFSYAGRDCSMFGGGVVFWRTGVVFVCMVVSSRGCNGLVFCSSFLCWGVAASVNECRKVVMLVRSVGCVRSVFPCFWRLDYHLFFVTCGFVAMWFGFVVPLVLCFWH